MNTLPFLKSYLSNLAHLAVSAAAWTPVLQWQTAVFVFCCLGAVMAPIAAGHDARAASVRARE